MTHKYPFGAIESEEPLLLGLLGQTLYGVHGLGPSSFLSEMRNVRNLHTVKFEHSSYSARFFDWTYPDEDLNSSSALGDLNIGAHHNHHYLFHNREDAEAYLAWARENTPAIGRDSWDDYDYDYYGDDGDYEGDDE